MPPIPAPRADGYTTSTPLPLYWCRYAPLVPESRMLVLHGGPGAHHEYLLPQMLALAETRECVFYDQRGGGRSKTDDRTPITWQTQVQDLTAVIAELAPGPLTLVGYSWGALLTLLYAMESNAGRAGAVPARMVLINPAPATRTFRNEFEAEFARRQSGPEVAALREALAASGLRERDPEAFKQRTFELSVAGYFADPARARELTPFRGTGRVQQSIWESLGAFDLLPGLRDLRIPSLVVHGRQDPIPLASAAEVASALSAQTAWLDDCGHVPYVEQPDALFSALREFLHDTESLIRPS
ncbi:MAG: alpha/beta hydrolase [Gemmatimonadaceae bacterium]|nr:alpha/beta hydrolase [Gemmatimonadaceae bacterium]